MADAAAAQDTADKKRRVFTTTPTTPYDVGDLWAQGTSGELMRCKTAKTSSQSYAAADWEKASKYTDDTKANAAKSAADAAQADADALKERMTSAETSITQNSEQIALRATKTEVTTAIADAKKAGTDAQANVDALTTRVTAVETSVTQNADTIALRATKTDVTAAIDALEIGGRNYILNSDVWKLNGGAATGITRSVENGIKKIVTASGNGNWDNFFRSNKIADNFKEGDTFTFGIEMKSDDSTKIPTMYFKSGMGYYKLIGTMGSEYSWFHYTGTWKEANQINFHLGWSGVVGTFYLRRIMFVKGDKLLDWTPAPEDVKSEISALDTRVTSAESSITILANSIASNVTETTNLGTRTSTLEQTADGLTARMSTAESDITTAQSTANTAKTNAATAQTTANTAKTNAATAQSTADEAKKTATNFLSFDTTNGVLIGNKTSGSWSGTRAQITGSAFNIIDSSGTTLSSYGSTTTIGKTAGNNMYIDSDGVYVRKNGKVLATFDQYGLKIANTNDSSGSLGSGTSKPALVIGAPTGYHIEMDNNEIMAKSNATTSSHLFLNMEGGNVSINNNASRALMFQDGALYAKNASYYNGDYLGIIDALNENGNTTFGYGGYINKIGATKIYGNGINLISNGNIDVEASWINCRSITPSDNATYALGTYGEKGWSNIYLGKGDGKTNALHIISGSSTYTLCGVNSSGQYIFGNNAAVMYYQVKDVNETTTGNAFKVTSGNNTAANNTSSVWFFGAADSTSRYIGSYLAYNRTYSTAANMVVTGNGVFGRSTSSSQRYKKDISVADIDELKGLYDLPVKKFKYKDNYIATDDELYNKYLYGFIVEDLENVLPCAVQHKEENGTLVPEMWNSNIIIPSLLKLIQDLNNRLKVLEKEE